MTTIINREWALLNKASRELVPVAAVRPFAENDIAPMTFSTRRDARDEKSSFEMVVPVMVTYEYELGA